MIDYALTSLQPVAPVTVTHGGLLNASVTDGLGWLITLLALCAMPMLTRQGRDSLKALWAPVGSFLCRIGGAFLLGSSGGGGCRAEECPRPPRPPREHSLVSSNR